MANSDPDEVSIMEITKANDLATSFLETEDHTEAMLELGWW